MGLAFVLRPTANLTTKIESGFCRRGSKIIVTNFRCWCYYTLTFLTLKNPELNPICYLLALLGAYHFLNVSGIRVKSLTLGLLMSYIWSTYS